MISNYNHSKKMWLNICETKLKVYGLVYGITEVSKQYASKDCVYAGKTCHLDSLDTRIQLLIYLSSPMYVSVYTLSCINIYMYMYTV